MRGCHDLYTGMDHVAAVAGGRLVARANGTFAMIAPRPAEA